MKIVQIKCVAKTKINKAIVEFIYKVSQKYEWGGHEGSSCPEEDQRVYIISIEAPGADEDDVEKFTGMLRKKSKKNKAFKKIIFTVKLLNR